MLCIILAPATLLLPLSEMLEQLTIYKIPAEVYLSIRLRIPALVFIASLKKDQLFQTFFKHTII